MDKELLVEPSKFFLPPRFNRAQQMFQFFDLKFKVLGPTFEGTDILFGGIIFLLLFLDILLYFLFEVAHC